MLRIDPSGRMLTWARCKLYRASQFSRYLLGTVGDLDRDKNARPGVIKLIKDNTLLAFLAPFKRGELRRPVTFSRFPVLISLRALSKSQYIANSPFESAISAE
jgi:hypothetical protein